MERIAIDMDEVMADTLAHQLSWLHAHYGHRITPTDLHGKKPRALVPNEHIVALESAMHAGTFFESIPVMADALEVLPELCRRFEVFVATAAMNYPKSCHAKFDWLQRHFPCISKDRFVFCGDKSIVRADFLIDDSPRHFENFEGSPLLFEAPHNVHETGFERMRGWRDVATRFKI